MVHIELASLIFDYDIHFSPICDVHGPIKELESWKMNLVAAGGNLLFVAVGDRVLVRVLGEHTGELLESHSHFHSQPNAMWLKPPYSPRAKRVDEEQSETAAYREQCSINAIRMVSIWDAEGNERQYLLTANGLGDICLFEVRKLLEKLEKLEKIGKLGKLGDLGEVGRELPVVVLLATHESAWSMAVDGGRAILFVGNNSHKVYRFPLGDRLPRCRDEIPWESIIEHDHNVPSVDVTPDGNLIASFSIDGTCRIFNAVSGATIKAPLGNQWGWACRWVGTRDIDQLRGPVTFVYDGPEVEGDSDPDSNPNPGLEIENIVIQTYEDYDEFLLGHFGGHDDPDADDYYIEHVYDDYLDDIDDVNDVDNDVNDVDEEEDNDINAENIDEDPQLGLDHVYSLNVFQWSSGNPPLDDLLYDFSGNGLLDDFSDMRAIYSASQPSLVPEDAWPEESADSNHDSHSHENSNDDSDFISDTAELLQRHRTDDFFGLDSIDHRPRESNAVDVDVDDKTAPFKNTDIIGNWVQCLAPEHWLATYGPKITHVQVKNSSADPDWIMTQLSPSSGHNPDRTTTLFSNFFGYYESEESDDDRYHYSSDEEDDASEEKDSVLNSHRLAIFKTECPLPPDAFLLALCSERDLIFVDPGSGEVVHRITDLVHCFDLPGRIHTNPLWLSMNRLSLIEWVPSLSTLFVASQVGILIACHLSRLSDSDSDSDDGHDNGRVQFTCVSFPELYRACPMAGFTVYPRHADGGPDYVGGWLLHVVYWDAHEATVSISRKPIHNTHNLP